MKCHDASTSVPPNRALAAAAGALAEAATLRTDGGPGAKSVALRTSLLALAVTALGSALIATPSSATAADEPPVLELHLPYPLTGPREIQASDRVTRRYRAVASHASPPITDVAAATVEAALRVDLGARIARTRQDDPAAFHRLGSPSAMPYVLLAGDDVLRTTDRDGAARNAGIVPLPKVIEPLAWMPYVLLCNATSCGHPAGRPTGIDGATAAIRTMASAGEWSTGHFAARSYARHLGLAPLLVPYSGGNTVVSALVSGQAQAAFVALPLALGYLRHDKLRALAAASEQRIEAAPGLPTLRERGVPVVVEGWFALFGSQRLDAARASRIGAAVRAYRLEPATRAEWTVRGLVPVTADAESFRTSVEAARSAERTGGS